MEHDDHGWHLVGPYRCRLCRAMEPPQADAAVDRVVDASEDRPRATDPSLEVSSIGLGRRSTGAAD